MPAKSCPTPTGNRSLHKGAHPFTLTRGKPGERRMYIEVNQQRHSMAVQGEWWYRGVISVEPHARGSLLVYRVYNIAPGAGWWAAQLVQGPSHARRMRETHLQPLLNAIGERLSCATHLDVE